MLAALKFESEWTRLTDLNRCECYRFNEFFIKKMKHNEMGMNRIESEYKVTEGLRHNDNFSVMIDYCVDKGFMYTMYKYYGVDLFEYGLYEKSDVVKLKVIVACAKALMELHTRGITHGDIKLENILIADGNIKICDFEFAFSGDIFKHSSGVNCTIGYAAPEVFHFSKLTFLIDVWSFGIMCYVIAYMHYPFNGKDKNEIGENVCKQEFKLRGSIFDPIIKICLQKNAAQRADMKTVLDRLVELTC